MLSVICLKNEVIWCQPSSKIYLQVKSSLSLQLRNHDIIIDGAHCLWKNEGYLPISLFFWLCIIRKSLTAPEQLTCWLVSDYYISLGNWLILIIFFPSMLPEKKIYLLVIIFSVLSASMGSFVVFIQILTLLQVLCQET